jgi:hypothetical protein
MTALLSYVPDIKPCFSLTLPNLGFRVTLDLFRSTIRSLQIRRLLTHQPYEEAK